MDLNGIYDIYPTSDLSQFLRITIAPIATTCHAKNLLMVAFYVVYGVCTV